MFNVGILIWENAEVLDFCGPFEAFRNAARFAENDISVFTVSKTTDPVDAQGLSINPTYGFDNCSKLDILIIPGGNSSWMVKQDDYLQWIDDQSEGLQHILTVCTGALPVAKLGYLKEGMEATTHQEGMPYLQEMAPNAKVLQHARFTDNGKIIMSGGISAGIDSSLYLIMQLWGEELANKIATYMEYDWKFKKPNLEIVFS